MKKPNLIYGSRLAAVLLVSIFLFVQNAFAQNVALKFDKTPLKEVVEKVQKASGYSFVYSDQNLDTGRLITANYSGPVEPINKLLDAIFAKSGIYYKVNGKQIAISDQLVDDSKKKEGQDAGENGGATVKSGRPFVLRGTVIDNEGQPVVGATVHNLKDNTYTVTNDKGEYSLNVKDAKGVSMEFSFLGMNTVVEPLQNRSILDVTMKSDKLFLDEVVVTGYQDIQKKKVTGAIATVSSNKIEERYTSNIMNNLEGRVAGLSTYGGKLTIRGVSSIYAEANPLLVVDGLPIEGSIEDINPYDVESVSILKDAAAAAIYGARASNGIVIIITKGAKTKDKIDIDFSSNVTIKEKQNMDYSDNFYMNAAQQVKTESDYYEYYFFNNEGEVTDPIGSTTNSINAGTGEITPIQYAYYQLAKGEITRDQLTTTLNSLSKNNFAKEYADKIYRRQVIQQYNLALRSRSDKSQSSFVMNYKTDNSGIINTFDNSLNVSFKGSYDVAKWLTATVAVDGIFGKSREKGTDYNGISSPWEIPAYESMYNSDGSDRLFYSWYNGNRYWNGTSAEGLTDLGINIEDEYYKNTMTTNRQYMRYHGDLLFKIFKGLTATAQFVYETNHSTANWLVTEDSHAARSMRNAYAYVDKTTGKVTSYVPTTGGFRGATNTDGNYWTGRGQLNYTNTFGKHSITALAGLEFRETLYSGTNSLMLGYDDQLQNASTQTIDFATISQLRNGTGYFMPNVGGYPAYQFVYEPYISGNMSPVVEQHHRYASGYANITYTYDERYNLFGSFRKDYADVYGLNVKFRGKPLWSVGTSWNINNEEFMKGVKWIDALKLRFSYGVTGNIYQGATSYMTATSTGLNYYTNLPYGEVESPANPNLKWEQTHTFNVGVDYAFLQNRVRGSLDFYRKTGTDLFSNRALDPTTGFSTMFMNSADMINRGVELTVSADWFAGERREQFGWSTTLTFAYNKNVITAFENASTRAYELVNYTPYKVGYPSSAVWSYRFAGISSDTGMKGETLWYGDNDVISHDAQSASISALEYSGQSEPTTIAGLDNRLTWNGLSLSVMMSYYGGNVMHALCENETFGVPSSAIPSYFLNAWTPENPTNTPGIGRYASQSIGSETRYGNNSIYDASFLKIRNIVFGYELPDNWIKKIHADRIALQFQIDNPPALWTANKVGVDPETLGIRSLSSYIFGVNINF
jgi:TonB-linked SusC/RagA family outer membrane protein